MKIRLVSIFVLVTVLTGISTAIFLLSVHEDDKPLSATEQTQASVNRAKIEPCRKTPAICAGGFAKGFVPGKMLIHEVRLIKAGCLAGDEYECLDILMAQTDEYLGNIEIVLSDEPKWKQVAIEYAWQFVAMKKETDSEFAKSLNLLFRGVE